MTRVLYLIPELAGPPGGIARYSRIACDALIEGNAELTVMALKDSLSAQRNRFTACSGVSYEPCGQSRRRFVQRSIGAVVRDRPDIILAGHPNFSLLGWLLSRMIRAPMVSFVYGIDITQPLGPIRRRALQRSDRVFSISQFTAQRATEANGILPNRVRILHNCLDPWFDVPYERREGLRQPSLLTVARLSLAERYKGHDYVIRAMPTLRKRFPGLVYHVVGGGDWQSELESLASRLGVAEAIRFHGFVSEEELRQHYIHASLFIMPSRGEGFGFVFLEAMAHGLPVIGGNVDATPEVVRDGETGFLVNPTSVESIVTAASRLLDDPALRSRMGAAARRWVGEQFNYPGFRERLHYLLGEVLKERGVPAALGKSETCLSHGKR